MIGSGREPSRVPSENAGKAPAEDLSMAPQTLQEISADIKQLASRAREVSK